MSGSGFMKWSGREGFMLGENMVSLKYWKMFSVGDIEVRDGERCERRSG